jgi:NAD(P)-dependent dehydrogenase (short-subunit alcohol dehydrogenase family)
MFELTGRRVIITGAAQGFGKEFARRLLQENCSVCISDINIDTGTKTKSEFQKEFKLTENELCFVKCNVAVEQDWIDLWDNAEKLLNGPIEILINNAGVHPAVSFFDELDFFNKMFKCYNST